MPYKNITADDLFQCQMCGDCCYGYGGTFVFREDIVRIADFLSVTPEYFVKEYCTFAGNKALLRQKADGYCVFWDGKCSIHPVKPRMCRQWPFIESVLTDVGNWDIMASLCPGIRTGFPAEVIKNCIRKELAKKR